jgi:drug/metabolite transporter (DMT)-like permease
VLGASIASREIDPDSTIAWMALIGLAVIAPFVFVFASLHELTMRTVWLLTIAGVTNIAGIALEYRAVRLGKVGVVTAIASCEGMAATLLAIATGAEALSPAVFVILLLLTVGVMLAVADSNAFVGTSPVELRRLLVLALPVPIIFGITLFCLAEVNAGVSVLWAILPTRLAGALLVGLPLAARRRLHFKLPVLPTLVAAEILEIVGFAAYVWGSRSGLSVAAVLASQFAAFSTAGAYLLLRERLDRRQLLGLALVAAGVGALALVQGA